MLKKIREFFHKKNKSSESSKSQKSTLANFSRFLINVAFVIFLAYFASSAVISFVLKKIVPPVEGMSHIDSVENDYDSYLKKMNYRNFQKMVVGRNIFNDTGELPVEEEALAEETKSPQSKFSLDGPCPLSKLNLTLLGTIVLANNNSFATVQEKGVSYSDIYKVGDGIFGKEGIKVAGIRRNTVILNNQGKKECLYATEEDETSGQLGSGLISLKKKKTKKADSSSGSSDGLSVVKLKAAWIQSELGAGFTKIMQNVSTPPNVVEGEIRGFKFYGISSGSLLGKMGLKNGDIVVDVNGQSTSDSIFILYQALNDEKEVLVNYERNGQKQSVKVVIE